MVTDSNTAPGMNFAKIVYTQENDASQTTVFVRFISSGKINPTSWP
jgi:hypothetical protein